MIVPEKKDAILAFIGPSFTGLGKTLALPLLNIPYFTELDNVDLNSSGMFIFLLYKAYPLILY
jgi:hypothetical protein